VQYGTAALTTLLVGALSSTTHLPLAWVIFGTQSLAMVAAWVGWRGRPAE
jgi:uncharacterized membrane protein AbrB (regulator of aidB expression)